MYICFQPVTTCVGVGINCEGAKGNLVKLCKYFCIKKFFFVICGAPFTGLFVCRDSSNSTVKLSSFCSRLIMPQ